MRKIEVEEVASNQDHLTKLKNDKKNYAKLVDLANEQANTLKQIYCDDFEAAIVVSEQLRSIYVNYHNQVVQEIAVIEHGIK